MDIKFSV